MENFNKIINPRLGIYLSEFVKQKIRGKQRYSPFNKWIAVNILVACGVPGYNFIRQLLPIPSLSTIQNLLKLYKMAPGVNEQNVKMLKLKVNPKNDKERIAYLLMDEVSLRKGLVYDQRHDLISGFEDDGVTRKNKLVKSALCVMAVGVVKKWKYPIGYFLSSKPFQSARLMNIVKHSIKMVEKHGFNVVGITTDQGSNFESTFKMLGCSPTNPKIQLGDKSYFIHKDVPHLLKNSRNFLLNGAVNVPGYPTKAAEWEHIEKLFETDVKNSFKLVPRITRKHVYKLKFATKMKVKIASQILSNSSAAALNFLIATNKIPSAAAATSSYCKTFNDIFDVLNSSSPKDRVRLRRPLHKQSPSIGFLQKAKLWLSNLCDLNTHRPKCPFIMGWVQTINATMQLLNILQPHGVKYLSTRNINQDPLELFFGKIRLRQQFPNAHMFIDSYAKSSIASLVRAPLTGNCENDDSSTSHLNETVEYLNAVSYFFVCVFTVSY